MLTVTDLACVRGYVQLFRGISFSLQSGVLLHLKGANGSGKTSLLRLVCGLGQPASGQVSWRGTPIRALGEEYYRDVFYLGHANGLKDELNAVENLCIAARLAGEAASVARANEALRRLGLEECKSLPTKLLSQGQKRRSALARLLFTAKPLWILDEPFAALDSGAVVLLEGVLDTHLAAGGMVLLTSHQEVNVKIAARHAIGLTL